MILSRNLREGKILRVITGEQGDRKKDRILDREQQESLL